MTHELKPAEGSGYLIDAYVYQLSQADCNDEYTPQGGGWYGLLLGGQEASATAALDAAWRSVTGLLAARPGGPKPEL